MPFSTLWWLTKKGAKGEKKRKIFKRHTSALKPTLTEENKVTRLFYAVEQIDTSTINNGTRGAIKYQDMMNQVHVDEKWFFLCQDGERYILVEDEEPPKRCTRHKGYITKVMFLCAQARPRMVNGQIWDGKIGKMAPPAISKVMMKTGLNIWQSKVSRT